MAFWRLKSVFTICNIHFIKNRIIIELIKKAEQIAIKLRDKLCEYNDFIGLYLYSSQVNRKATRDSDVDIVGVFIDNKDNDDTISMKIFINELKNRLS